MSGGPKRGTLATAPDAPQKDLLQQGDISAEIRLKCLQLAHVPGRQSNLTIDIAKEFEEYVLTGKPKGPVNTAG